MVLGGGAMLLHYHAGVTQAWLQEAQKRLAEIKLEQVEVLASSTPTSAAASMHAGSYAVMA